MKQFKPRPSPRPSAETALAAAALTAPQHPPATVQPGSSADRPAVAPPVERTMTLNLRVKENTVRSLAEAARARGLTQKQVIMHSLQQMGVQVAEADLEDRTPRRKM